MIQLCRIDLHLTLAILPSQMDVWQPKHTLDTQACTPASKTHVHTHSHTLVKVTMLHETKGQMVDSDNCASIGKVVKICISVCVCAWMCLYTSLSSFNWVMHAQYQSNFYDTGLCMCVGLLNCLSSPIATQNGLPEAAVIYF